MARRRLLSAALTLLLVGLAVGVLADVTAATIQRDRSDCGSLPQTLSTRTGYHGGEVRPDEPAFDRACVAAAERRAVWLGAGAVVASVLAAYLWATGRRPRSGGVGPPLRLR